MNRLFSERNGYRKVSDVIIREQMPLEVQNAVCNCHDDLQEHLKYCKVYPYGNLYEKLENHIWTYFLNRRNSMYSSGLSVSTGILESNKIDWYRKLDLIEETLSFLDGYARRDFDVSKCPDLFIRSLNYNFERQNYAYRVVEGKVVEVTSGEELPGILKPAFEKLYAYTNRPDTGIRHALMDDQGRGGPLHARLLQCLHQLSAKEEDTDQSIETGRTPSEQGG